MNMLKKWCKIVSPSALSVILIISGLMCIFFAPPYITSQIKNSLPIEDTAQSLTYDKWVKLPLPIYNRFYLFNITNVDNILNLKHDPNVEQIGPFVYKEERHKIDLAWNEENKTVHYKQIRRWIFVSEMSNGSLDDEIYHLNVPLIAAAEYVRNHAKNPFDRFLLSKAINDLQKLTRSVLFPKHSVRQLMFEGYTDAFLKISASIKMPGLKIPSDYFGWFYAKNDTASDGEFEIFTGSKDLARMGLMYSWNNKTELDMFKGSCNSLNGVSAGDFQPPFAAIAPGNFKIFVGDICRPLKLNYKNKVTINGVTANRYQADEYLFNYTLEENKCYCDNKECPTNGVADISKCLFESPAAISLPHFLYGDKSLTDNIKGLNPDPKLHGFFMDVHPMLGVPINVNVGMQINVVVNRQKGISFLRNMAKPQVYFPMIWFSATAGLDDSMADDLRLLANIWTYLLSACIVLEILGVTVLGVTLWFARGSFIRRAYTTIVSTNAPNE